MGEKYQSTPKITTKNLGLPDKFIQRVREKKAKGEDYQYWVRAARIINHIELNIPVGFDRLRRGRKSRRKAGKAVAA